MHLNSGSNQTPEHLPTPPSEEQKRWYEDQNKLILTTFGTISLAFLSTGMFKFALNHPYFWLYAVFASFLTFYLTISYVVAFCGSVFDRKTHDKIIQENRDFVPTVDVFLPNCGEDLDVLENTFKHVANLEWDLSKLKVYCLDDKGRKEVEILARSYGFEYVCRPNRGELKKSGNVRYTFPRSSGEFILILDADFCPRPDMLQEVVPYFKSDEEIGIMQTPQFFEITPNQSAIQKGAAYIQELFYRLIQVNRNTWGASICVGTCAVYRRKALELLGGTYPIEHSEDVHTGFYLMGHGWKLKYIPINLSKGLCPDSLRAFFNQQYRWCTGSTTLFLSKMFWSTKLSFMQRISYLSGMLYYSATAMGIFLTPLPGIVMCWFQPEHVLWYNAMFSVPSFLFGHIYPGIWSKAPMGWYSFRARLVSYYAHFFAVTDKIKHTTAEWVPSGSKADTNSKVSRFDTFRSLLMWWTIFCLVATVAGMSHYVHSFGQFENFIPTLFFTLFNFWVAMPILRDQ